MYQVTFTGLTPLLMHADNIEWADQMDAWKDLNARKKSRGETADASKAGDDRTPAWRWIGCLWNDETRVVIPQDALRRCLIDSAQKMKTAKGSLKKTIAGQITLATMAAPLLVRGKEIPLAPILALSGEPQFSAHKAAVKAMGFDLMVKRAAVQRSKHVRVRPIFAGWSVAFDFDVFDTSTVSLTVVEDLVSIAGQSVGLGDWRPGAPMSPGPYGRFDAKVKKS